MADGENKVMQVLNYMKASKKGYDFYFWMNYPFNKKLSSSNKLSNSDNSFNTVM